jgi:hypothetical protein
MIWLFTLRAYILAFLRGETCPHPTRVYTRGIITCGRCRRRLGRYT